MVIPHPDFLYGCAALLSLSVKLRIGCRSAVKRARTRSKTPLCGVALRAGLTIVRQRANGFGAAYKANDL